MIQMHDHIRDMGRRIAEQGSMPLLLWHCTTNNIEDLLEQRTTVSTLIIHAFVFSLIKFLFEVFYSTERYVHCIILIHSQLKNEVQGIKMVSQYDDILQHTEYLYWYPYTQRHLSFSKGLYRRFRYLRLVVTE